MNNEQEEFRLCNEPVNSVKVKLLSGDEFYGLITNITRYEIKLLTREGQEIILFKGAISFVEKLDGGQRYE